MTIADSQKISEILHVQYKSIFTIPQGHLHVGMPDEFFGPTALHNKIAIIGSISIEETDMTSAIDEMGSNQVTGLDRFPAIVQTKCQRS